MNIHHVLCGCHAVQWQAMAWATKSQEPVLRNQIRRLRFDGGRIPQQDLAEQVGVTRQTIIALEANPCAPSLPLAVRVARVFGVTVGEVFQDEFGALR